MTTKKTIEQKKVDILNVATTLFAEKGYEATTMAEIAKLANVSFGSVATYFKNKETLLYMCVKEPMEEFLIQALAFQTEPNHYETELAMLTNKHFQLFHENRIYLLLLVQMIAQSEKYATPFLVVHEAAILLTEKIEQLIKNGQRANQLREGNANTIATSYISLIFGLFLSNPYLFAGNVLNRFSQTSMRLFGLN